MQIPVHEIYSAFLGVTRLVILPELSRLGNPWRKWRAND